MGHYFTNNKNTKSNPIKHYVSIKNHSFEFLTDHGVFSKKGLDFGSRLLIEAIIDESFDQCLDLGCGYGPIGIVLKYFHPKAQLDMVDVNERAVELAKKNANNNHIDVNVFVSDAFENVEKNYDMIVTNPPIRAGKKVIYNIFESAKKYLREQGSLYVVIQKKQGAPSAMAFCQSIYDQVEVVKKKSGYLVFKCSK